MTSFPLNYGSSMDLSPFLSKKDVHLIFIATSSFFCCWKSTRIAVISKLRLTQKKNFFAKQSAFRWLQNTFRIFCYFKFFVKKTQSKQQIFVKKSIKQRKTSRSFSFFLSHFLIAHFGTATLFVEPFFSNFWNCSKTFFATVLSYEWNLSSSKIWW